MAEPTRGWTRALRCAVLAAVVVALAAVAHVLGGGADPSPVRILVLFGLTLGPCAALTARRLAGPTLVAVVGVGQVALHHALMLGASMSAPSAHMHGGHAMAAMPGMQHGHAATGPVGSWHLPDLAGALTPGAAPMLLTHAAAAALTALVLARGERVAWELWLALPHLFELRPVRLPEVVTPAVPMPDTAAFTAFTGLGWARILRGPPLVDAR